jgi:hypothetical protein
MKGGNEWMAGAVLYLDSLGKLRFGRGLPADQVSAVQNGRTRPARQSREAALLSDIEDRFRIVDLTCH